MVNYTIVISPPFHTEADADEGEVTPAQSSTEREQVSPPFFQQELKKVVCEGELRSDTTVLVFVERS